MKFLIRKVTWSDFPCITWLEGCVENGFEGDQSAYRGLGYCVLNSQVRFDVGFGPVVALKKEKEE